MPVLGSQETKHPAHLWPWLYLQHLFPLRLAKVTWTAELPCNTQVSYNIYPVRVEPKAWLYMKQTSGRGKEQGSTRKCTNVSHGTPYQNYPSPLLSAVLSWDMRMKHCLILLSVLNLQDFKSTLQLLGCPGAHLSSTLGWDRSTHHILLFHTVPLCWVSKGRKLGQKVSTTCSSMSPDLMTGGLGLQSILSIEKTCKSSLW